MITTRRELLKHAAMAGLMMSVPSFPFDVFSSDNKAGGKEPFISAKRVLGKGGYALNVSALGFGVMGMTYNRGPAPDKKSMINLLHKAVDYGITLFDTAEIYGPYTNERLAGDALSRYQNKIHISTKFGHDIINGIPTGKQNSRPENIRKVAEESLKRLKIDRIAIFYQHRFDPNVPIEDVAGTVKDLIKEGKVQCFGLCEVGPDIIKKAHREQPVTALQSEYHIMWREPEKIFPVLETLGIGFVPYSPLNRGYLTGKIDSGRKFDPKNDNRGTLPRFTAEAMKANRPVIELLKKVGKEKNATPAQIALAWLLAKKTYIVPIPGTTDLNHLKENLGALDVTWTKKEMADFDAALSKIKITGDRYNAEEQKKVENKK